MTSNVFNLNAGLDFSVKGLSYDANGNILAMNQRGWKVGGSLTIDSLLYTYYTGSNRLKNVLDRKNDTATQLGDFRSSRAYMMAQGNNKTTSATDYTYDVNGNMNVDNNKDISAIYYNHLNLPDSIVVTGKGSIKYIYDANGIKWKKIIHETNKPDKTTLYMGATVFENDTLQFISHEEGRTRFRTDNNSLHYDYFLKDHLGNVRMILTEEYRQDVYPAATLENVTYNGGTAVSKEDDYYSIDNLKIVTQPGGVTYQNNNGNPPYNSVNPYSNTAANSGKMYQLNASTNKTGLGIAIKVVAGDVINIYGKSYYSGSSGGTNTLPVTDLLTALLATSGLSGKGYTVGQINTPTLSSNVGNFLSNGRTQSVKAYINWILFDEQFNFAGGGFDPVNTTSGAVKTHNAGTIPAISVAKSGYIFVYCSNESILNVLFDNLQVIHTRGALVEETHYYPFGLTMAGISSKALAFGGPENKRQWNKGSELESKEFTDGSGLELYSTFYRSLDPQLGRFWQIDPRPTVFESLYAAMGNNPIINTDYLGDSIAPGRTKEMNFFVTANKKLRKADRWDHNPLNANGSNPRNMKGPFKKLRASIEAAFSSAYSVDNFKARVKSALSFGKMKVVSAGDAKEATDKIISKLGSNGYVKNLTIDYHAGTFGNQSLNSSTSELSRLAGGYAGDASTCYLGQCWAGGNAALGRTDYTGAISGALDGATVYGNQAAASSISFALRSNFIGVVPLPYSKDPDNLAAVGKHTVTSRDATGATMTRTTTNTVRITNSGSIEEN